jgi:hypothetical protein
MLPLIDDDKYPKMQLKERKVREVAYRMVTTFVLVGTSFSACAFSPRTFEIG